MITVYVLFLIVASPGTFSGTWGQPVEVGEFATKADCQHAGDDATYNYQKNGWKTYDSGVICIQRRKS